MRRLPLLLAMLATCIDATGASRARELVSTDSVAFARAISFHMITADDTPSSSHRLIAWDDILNDVRTAHLTLCSRDGACTWSHDWAGSYDPTIAYMGRWSNDRTNVFLLTYYQGAEAETAVVISWSPGSPPVIRDQHDGSWIALAPDNETIEINTTSGTEVALACLRWNQAAMRLGVASCSWLPARSSRR